MMINLKLEGFPEEILNLMVERKIASNKTEAIRLALFHYNEHFKIKEMRQYLEDELVVRKIQAMEKDVKQGKKKMLSAKEALGEEYAAMLK